MGPLGTCPGGDVAKTTAAEESAVALSQCTEEEFQGQKVNKYHRISNAESASLQSTSSNSDTASSDPAAVETMETAADEVSSTS